VLLTDSVALFATLVAAGTDVARGKVYNWITYPVAILGLLLAAFVKNLSLTQSIAGLVITLAVFYPLSRAGAMGTGDVKLIAAIGALKGLPFVLVCFFYTLCAASVIGLIALAWKGRLMDSARWLFIMITMRSTVGTLHPKSNPMLTTMPFAPSVFIGLAYAVYLETINGPIDLSWWLQ